MFIHGAGWPLQVASFCAAAAGPVMWAPLGDTPMVAASATTIAAVGNARVRARARECRDTRDKREKTVGRLKGLPFHSSLS